MRHRGKDGGFPARFDALGFARRTGRAARARLAVAVLAAALAACGRLPAPAGGFPAPADGGPAPSSRTAGDGGAAAGGSAAPHDAQKGSGLRPGAGTGVDLLGGSAEEFGFEKALVSRRFEFPADYGSHPSFRTEWWYYTGNLFGPDGRHFGFELTIFRFALAPRPPSSPSLWATNQVYMAHFAVTDTESGRLLAEERLSRGALGLAGAQADPFRVWVEDWSAASANGGFRLAAKGSKIALDLELDSVKPPVPQGEAGLDRKGPEPGNASYYYSLTRLNAHGTVSVEGKATAVKGTAWMDREWSTSALSPSDEGWDWFALQLSDGRDLMYYRLRRKDGRASAFSGGTLVSADGESRRLESRDVVLEPLEYWTSGKTRIRYPVAWRLRAEKGGLDLTIRPYLPNQEIDLSVRYWEGAVRVEGKADGAAVLGNGYLELAGYR